MHKNYTIRSTPVLSDRGRWGVKISIAWEHDGAELDLPFSSDTPCLNVFEAEDHGITFGQRLIDGKVPALSVDQEPVLLLEGK
jgi:hypothetical protein